MIMLSVFMIIALLPLSTRQTLFAEGDDEDDDDANDTYTAVMNMANNPPSDWNQEKDPYGYGLGNDFFLNSQQELLLYRYRGHSDQTIKSYDTLKEKNEGYPLNGTKSADDYSIPQSYTLSHARTVALTRAVRDVKTISLSSASMRAIIRMIIRMRTSMSMSWIRMEIAARWSIWVRRHGSVTNMRSDRN